MHVGVVHCLVDVSYSLLQDESFWKMEDVDLLICLRSDSVDCDTMDSQTPARFDKQQLNYENQITHPLDTSAMLQSGRHLRH